MASTSTPSVQATEVIRRLKEFKSELTTAAAAEGVTLTA